MRSHNRTTNSERWSVVTARPVRNSAGKPYLAVSIFRDVTAARLENERRELLARASETLSSTLDSDRTLQELAKLAVPALADWCSISILGETGPRSVAVAHPDPRMLELVEKVNANGADITPQVAARPGGMLIGAASYHPLTRRPTYRRLEDSLPLEQLLVELRKPVDVMIYPNRTHAISEGPGTSVHVYRTIARYFLEHLPPGPR